MTENLFVDEYKIGDFEKPVFISLVDKRDMYENWRPKRTHHQSVVVRRRQFYIIERAYRDMRSAGIDKRWARRLITDLLSTNSKMYWEGYDEYEKNFRADKLSEVKDV